MRYLVLGVIILSMYLCVKTQTVFSELAASYAADGNYEEAIELEKISLSEIEKHKGKNNFVKS